MSKQDDANRLLPPNCQALIEAIGHRMAHDPAVAAGVEYDSEARLASVLLCHEREVREQAILLTVLNPAGRSLERY